MIRPSPILRHRDSLAAWTMVAPALLFASADPLLAAWVRALLPDWRMDNLILRGFIFVAFGGSLLGACYLALNPPRVDPPTGERRPVAHRYEWLLMAEDSLRLRTGNVSLPGMRASPDG